MDSRAILGEVLNLFPYLEQLRLWTTAIDTKYLHKKIFNKNEMDIPQNSPEKNRRHLHL